ncbi:MAG: ribonuclease P protein component [bacterium]|nr:ribonuclease P protein component [bacterium]
MFEKKYRLPIQQFYLKESLLNTNNNLPETVRKNSFFIVKTRKTKLPFSRFGVAVGSKVDKLATRRNFIRRNVIKWLQSTNFHQKPGKDVMIITLPKIKALGVGKKGIKNIQVELLKLFN